MTVIIDLDKAASFVADLVKEGVCFEAVQHDNFRMRIVFTGGF